MGRWGGWSATRYGPTVRVAASVLTGLLYACCFPPLSLWPLGWVALVPLLLAWRMAGPAPAALCGLLAGVAGTLASVHWLWVPLTHAYGFSAPAALLFLTGVAGYIGLFYALLGAAHALLARRATPWPLLWVPALWVAAELVRSRLGVGVPWLLAGHTQGEVLPLVQVAELTGVYGVSFVVVAVNFALVELLVRRRWQELAASAAAALCVLGYGGWRLAMLDRSAPPGSLLQVAIVQPDIPQEQKWDRSFFATGMQRLYRLTREAVESGSGPRPDLVLWPETALTVDVEGAATTLEPITALLHRSGASLLLGAPRLPRDVLGRGEVRNSAALLEPDGRVAGTYDKQILLPFGEYYPSWVRWITGLQRTIVRHMGELQFSPGRGTDLLTTRGIPFGVTICYEATYPELVGATVARGARFLVNLTNDAWFEHSAGAAQHLAMARLRAVEHRVPLVRVANTGISAIIQPSGRILSSLGLGVQGLLRGEIAPAAAPAAPYTRWGDLFASLCLIFVVTMPAAFLLCRRLPCRSRSRRDP